MKRGQAGGLTTAAKYGPEHFAAINKGAAFNAFGESKAARRLRAADVASKRSMTDAEWERLMRRRAASFGIPIERLIPRLRSAHLNGGE